MSKFPLTKILILGAALWMPVACGKVGTLKLPPSDTPYPSGNYFPVPEVQIQFPSTGNTEVKS